MLSAAEITSMAALIEETMPNTCVCKRTTFASDGKGGKTKSVTTVFTDSCAFYPKTQATDAIIGESNQVIVGWVVLLPLDRTVLPSDTLEIAGKVFEVLNQEDVSYDLVRRVHAKEIK